MRLVSHYCEHTDGHYVVGDSHDGNTKKATETASRRPVLTSVVPETLRLLIVVLLHRNTVATFRHDVLHKPRRSVADPVIDECVDLG